LSTRLRGSENNNFVQGLAINTQNYVSQRQLETGFKHKKSLFSGTSFTNLSRSKKEIEELIWTEQTISRDIFLKFPGGFLPNEVRGCNIMKPRSGPYINELRLLECC
jgi:hypothetical protein